MRAHGMELVIIRDCLAEGIDEDRPVRAQVDEVIGDN